MAWLAGSAQHLGWGDRRVIEGCAVCYNGSGPPPAFAWQRGGP